MNPGRWFRTVISSLLLLASCAYHASAQHIYFTDEGPYRAFDTIKRCNLDGTEITTLYTDPVWRYHNLRNLDLDTVSGKIYWTLQRRDATGWIQRANLDGTGAESVLEAVGTPWAITIDVAGRKMYWFDDGIRILRRANLDGTGIDDIAPVGDCRGIAIDTAAGKVYWTDSRNGAIARANIDGSQHEVLLQGGEWPHHPMGIALDVWTNNPKMYWADVKYLSKYRRAWRIMRANIDGTEPEVLVKEATPEGGYNHPTEVALDISSGKIYWADWFASLICRANLDGSDPETVVDLSEGGAVRIFGIALDVPSAPEPIEVAIDIKPGSDPNSVNLKSKGVLPVAILTTEAFDALDVAETTVELGDPELGETAPPVRSAEEDVDDDGDPDLLLFFRVAELVESRALDEMSQLLFLTGETVDGVLVEGGDVVRIVRGSTKAK